MNADQILAILRAHEADLHQRGVTHAALFGSVARGDQRADSDIDIMIETDPALRLSFFAHVGVKLFIADLFSGQVDVVNKKNLKPTLKPLVESEILYAF